MHSPMQAINVILNPCMAPATVKYCKNTISNQRPRITFDSVVFVAADFKSLSATALIGISGDKSSICYVTSIVKMTDLMM